MRTHHPTFSRAALVEGMTRDEQAQVLRFELVVLQLYVLESATPLDTLVKQAVMLQPWVDEHRGVLFCRQLAEHILTTWEQASGDVRRGLLQLAMQAAPVPVYVLAS